MFSVEFTQTAEKQFFKLEKSIRERVINVLERIKIRPFHFIKRKEGTPYFILRIGDYRAILNIDLKKIVMDNCVTYSSFNRSYTDRKLQNKCGIRYAVFYIYVLEVGHRKNIYENQKNS